MEDQPAWAPRLRSRSSMRTAAKRHFVDPCLAAAALGASPQKLLSDLNFLGFLFESLVVRDLCVYAQLHDANIFHYRDNTELEVDAIVERNDRRWAGIEVKLGSYRIGQGAKSLLTFSNRIDQTAYGARAFLACGDGHRLRLSEARRSDGATDRFSGTVRGGFVRATRTHVTWRTATRR